MPLVAKTASVEHIFASRKQFLGTVARFVYISVQRESSRVHRACTHLVDSRYTRNHRRSKYGTLHCSQKPVHCFRTLKSRNIYYKKKKKKARKPGVAGIILYETESSFPHVRT